MKINKPVSEMNRYEKLVWGMQRTQAIEVAVPFPVVADIIGEEEARALAIQVSTVAQKRTKIQPIERALRAPGQVTVEPLMKVNRADLLEIIEEIGLPKVDKPADKSALKILHEKMGKSGPSPSKTPQPSNKKEGS